MVVLGSNMCTNSIHSFIESANFQREPARLLGDPACVIITCLVQLHHQVVDKTCFSQF